MVAFCAPSGRAIVVPALEVALSGLKCMVEEEKGRMRRWMKLAMVYALTRPRTRRRNCFSLVVGWSEVDLCEVVWIRIGDLKGKNGFLNTCCYCFAFVKEEGALDVALMSCIFRRAPFFATLVDPRRIRQSEYL
jgi:hypothetical protein